MVRAKKWMACLVFAVLLLTLVACGGSSGGGSSSGGAEPSPANTGSAGSSGTAANDEGSAAQTTLRVAWFGNQNQHDSALKVVELYQELNPHVHIEAEFASYEGYWERMAAQAAGGTLPDVMNQNFGEYLSQYTERGLLEDMTPFVESGLIDATHIDDNTLDMGTLNGQLVGIPIGINARTFIYDPEMFEKSGAKLPEFGWTWEDADEAARKIAEHYPYGIDNLETHRSAEVWIRQHGGRYFNDDGTGLGYDDDKIMENYFAMKLKWMQDGIAPTLNVVAEHNTQENSLIALGQVAMTSTWSNMIGNLSKVAKKPLSMAPYPAPKGDKSLFLRPTMLWSIPKTSQNKEEAAKFISFFINNLEANKILNADRGVPVNNEVMMEMMDFVDESTVKMFEYIQHLADHSSPIDKNHPVTAAEVLSVLRDVDEKVLYEQITPAEAAEEFRRRAEEVLSR